ncbi:MAG: succinate dehydrogenase, hydrophobic membrane anchor protein [Pseudomonadota bacterium]
MAKTVLGSTHRGLKEWTIQRLSAIYLLLYSVFIVVMVVTKPANYLLWRSFFYANIWLFIANVFFLLTLVAHAWIGVWTIITDYIKPPALRSLIKVIVWLLLVIFFIYGLVLFTYLMLFRGF